MDKTNIDKKHIDKNATGDKKRPTSRPARSPQERPSVDDVVRLEHERHKVLMDLLAK